MIIEPVDIRTPENLPPGAAHLCSWYVMDSMNTGREAQAPNETEMRCVPFTDVIWHSSDCRYAPAPLVPD
jgi:hypothetical protein